MKNNWLRDPNTPEWHRWFLGWLSFSLLTHLICSYFSVGYHSIDEYFQILEFLNFKLGHTPQAVLPVEFAEQMRPWLQPAFYYGCVKLLKWVGIESPFVWSWVFRIFCSCLGWVSLVYLAICSRFWFKDSRAKKFCLAAIGLLWFLPALHSRPSSEGLGGSFFVIGLCMTYLTTVLPVGVTRGRFGWWGALFSGVFFGLSFECRFQMAIMIFGALAWILYFKKARWEQLLACGAGFLLIFALGRWVDAWGYGVWAWSPWKYFSYNLVRGGVSQYGDSPWWDIFRMSLTESWPPLGLILLLGTLVAFVRHPRHLLTWAQVPFFMVHEMIGHKELRFFFPMVSAGPVLLTLCFYSQKSGFFSFYPIHKTLGRLLKWVLGLLVIDNCVALIVLTGSPASRTVLFYEALYQKKNIHPEITTLFTLERNPYEIFGSPTYFYHPPGLEVLKVESPDFLIQSIQKSESPIYLVHPSFDLPRGAPILSSLCHPIYQTLPHWVKYLNFQNVGVRGTWLERVNVWGLFECKRI